MKKKGFTLVELLAVITILGVIMIIAVPSYNRYIENARKKKCDADKMAIIDAGKAYITQKIYKNETLRTEIKVGDLNLDKSFEKYGEITLKYDSTNYIYYIEDNNAFNDICK